MSQEGLQAYRVSLLAVCHVPQKMAGPPNTPIGTSLSLTLVAVTRVIILLGGVGQRAQASGEKVLRKERGEASGGSFS